MLWRDNPRKRLLTLYEEFILTLIRIRRGWDVKETAVVLGISPCQVSRIFTSWVNLLHKCFKPLLEWPSTDMVKNNMPDSFKSAYPTTRVVIDCSELFVQKPRSIDAQTMTYSSYKSHNTFKFLLGIAPSGQVTYLSKLFSGSISDRDIVVKSGFLNLVSKDDNVMADRGFNIRDLLLKSGAYLNIPAFSSGKQLSARAASNSRKVEVYLQVYEYEYEHGWDCWRSYCFCESAEKEDNRNRNNIERIQHFGSAVFRQKGVSLENITVSFVSCRINKDRPALQSQAILRLVKIQFFSPLFF